MPVAVGQRLGPYEVQGLIGAGGMGEVYRASDTRLNRIVALKILPQSLASHPEPRPLRERGADSYRPQSPYICTMHDIGDGDEVSYFVMEHVAGDTPAQRLKKGLLTLGLDKDSSYAWLVDQTTRVSCRSFVVLDELELTPFASSSENNCGTRGSCSRTGQSDFVQ